MDVVHVPAGGVHHLPALLARGAVRPGEPHALARIGLGELRSDRVIGGLVGVLVAATAIVAMLPPMLIFLVLGRYIVRGLTFGAVKG